MPVTTGVCAGRGVAALSVVAAGCGELVVAMRVADEVGMAEAPNVAEGLTGEAGLAEGSVTALRSVGVGVWGCSA